MEDSFFLAQFIGIFSIVMGLSMLVKKKMLLSIFHELSINRALSYILGILLFMTGLTVVLNHNHWLLGFPLLITLLGWMVLMEGASYLFVSQKTMKLYMNTLNNKKIYYVIALFYLAIGVYLSYAGFLGQ